MTGSKLIRQSATLAFNRKADFSRPFTVLDVTPDVLRHDRQSKGAACWFTSIRDGVSIWVKSANVNDWCWPFVISAGVAVGSQSRRRENHTTGRSGGATWRFAGLIDSSVNILRSRLNVV